MISVTVKPGLHIAVTIAEHLKYFIELPIFLVKYGYSPPLQPCEYQGIPGKLKKCVCNHMLAILTTYMETRLESEISNVSNAVEGHCLQAIKIVHHHTNGRFDWLISEHQSINASREAISILSGKCKRFTFVHPVLYY